MGSPSRWGGGGAVDSFPRPRSRPCAQMNGLVSSGALPSARLCNAQWNGALRAHEMKDERSRGRAACSAATQHFRCGAHTALPTQLQHRRTCHTHPCPTLLCPPPPPAHSLLKLCAFEWWLSGGGTKGSPQGSVRRAVHHRARRTPSPPQDPPPPHPGCMFALLQPNRRQLTWYSATGRKGPWPSTPAIKHSDSKHREQ